jgi:hypothetical protein
MPSAPTGQLGIIGRLGCIDEGRISERLLIRRSDRRPGASYG